MAWVLGMAPTSRQLPVAKRWYAARSRSTSAWPPSAASGTGSWRSSRSGSTVSTGGRGGSGGAGCQKRSMPGRGLGPGSAERERGARRTATCARRLLDRPVGAQLTQPAEQRLPVPAAPAQDQERVVVERLGQQVEGRREVLAGHHVVRAAAALVELVVPSAGTAARPPRRRGPRARAAPRRPAAWRWAGPARRARSRPWPRPARLNAGQADRTSYGRTREPWTLARTSPGRTSSEMTWPRRA